MKKIRVICAILLAILVLFCNAATVFAAETSGDTQENGGNSVSYSISGTDSYLGAGTKIENVTSAFMYEYASGTLMYALNPDLHVPPSSLVKILTAYLAIERGDLEAVVTVDSKTLSEVPMDAVSVNLQAGEELTLRDLLMCMMVGSGNDAAAVIAAHISGNQDAFVQEMNAYVQSLGCVDTQFINAHGIHDDAQYSTVRDITRILAVAMENQAFRELFSTVDYDVPATNLSETRNLSSNNFLMNDSGMDIYFDDRVTGGRAGTASDGTRCLAATAEKNGLQMICVVTGAESTYDDSGNTTVYGSFQEASQLFDMAFDGYKKECILYPGQTMKQISVPNGQNDVILGVQDAVSVILPLDTELSDIQFRFQQPDTLQAPINKGDRLFAAEVWSGGACLTEVNVYAMNTVVSIYEQDDTEQRGSTASTAVTIILVCLGVLAAIAACFGGVYFVRILIKKKKNTQYRKSRRRSQ